MIKLLIYWLLNINDNSWKDLAVLKKMLVLLSFGVVVVIVAVEVVVVVAVVVAVVVVDGAKNINLN